MSYIHPEILANHARENRNTYVLFTLMALIFDSVVGSLAGYNLVYGNVELATCLLVSTAICSVMAAYCCIRMIAEHASMRRYTVSSGQ
jgi:uncharacterized membrane protein